MSSQEVIHGTRTTANVGPFRPGNRKPEAEQARELLARLNPEPEQVEAPPTTPSEAERQEQAERQERLAAAAEQRGLRLEGKRPHPERPDIPRDRNGWALADSGWSLFRTVDANTGIVRQLTPHDGITLDTVEAYLDTYPAEPTILEALRSQECQAVAESKRWVDPRHRDPYGTLKNGPGWGSRD